MVLDSRGHDRLRFAEIFGSRVMGTSAIGRVLIRNLPKMIQNGWHEKSISSFNMQMKLNAKDEIYSERRNCLW